jgi:hypothetical protein
MPRPSVLRGAFSGSFRHGRLWLVQIVANPLLAVLFAVWLLIPVANTWNVIENTLVALVIAVAIVVLHAGTLNYFYEAGQNLNVSALAKPAFLRALRHVLAVAVCIAVFYLFWRVLDRVDAYSNSLPAYLRSTMPASLRRYVTLNFLESAYAWKVFILRWLVFPGLILPFVLATARLGFQGLWRAGFAVWRRAVSCFSYWLVLAMAVGTGVLAAPAIVAWTPNFTATSSALRFESASLVLRVIIACALGLWAWLLACCAVVLASLRSADQHKHSVTADAQP